MVRGYERNPDADAEAFIDGWFRTGDSGHAWTTTATSSSPGGTKEIINRGGQKISPREVDDILLEHPAVAQAATFPVPHPTLGEDVAAAVVLRPQATATGDEIRRLRAGEAGRLQGPARDRSWSREIPKGPTGKMQRLSLATQLDLAGRRPAPGPTDAAAPTATETALAGIWAEVLQLEGVGVGDNFFQLGGDSIQAAVVVSRVADTLGCGCRSAACSSIPPSGAWPPRSRARPGAGDRAAGRARAGPARRGAATLLRRR